MKKTQINGIDIEYYDGDITEMPVVRFNTFQRFLLIDAGIGSSLQDADRHVARIQIYLQKKQYDHAITEAQNFRQNIRYVMERVTPKNMAFCALIYKVNGKPHTDMSDEGNTELCKRLEERISQRWFDRMIEAVKKKVRFN